MARLLYVMPASLDGYLADDGDLDWSAPDDEVLAFINDLLRPVRTYLYGRKMYETMTVWETPEVLPTRTPATLDFATIWQAADKIVYSKTLETVSTPKTRLEHDFHLQAIRELKAQLPGDITIAGPTLAAQAIRAGLVDEIHRLVVPFILGGGTPILPDRVRMKLDLVDERRIGSGWVYLRYRPTY
jgi:dihydrofolate reductase